MHSRCSPQSSWAAWSCSTGSSWPRSHAAGDQQAALHTAAALVAVLVACVPEEYVTGLACIALNYAKAFAAAHSSNGGTEKMYSESGLPEGEKKYHSDNDTCGLETDGCQSAVIGPLSCICAAHIHALCCPAVLPQGSQQHSL